MAPKPVERTKKTLDKDLDKLTFVDDAARFALRRFGPLGAAVLFTAFAMLVAGVYVFHQPAAVVVVAASALCAYMAMNIGANDVTNNVGAAVGARAITMAGALIMAAVFEILGATLAGSRVVETISGGIVSHASVMDAQTLTWIMMAALAAAAIWLNFATWLNAPVSTTHSIVGAVLGAGIAAGGVDFINWHGMAMIFVSWVISPLMGGVIAIGFLFLIKETIIYRDDKIGAACHWVPILIGVMAGSFTAFLAIQTQYLHGLSVIGATVTGMAVGLLSWVSARPFVRAQAAGLENRNSALRVLFRLPLIGAAALLSFAHGANDVSNAIGPLSALVHVTIESRDISAAVGVPAWVMAIGALGISVGLLLFGPRLIHLVGEQITKLNPARAFCVALSSAVTVIVASWFGLPVSSTHIAVGGVFGVGLFREWYTRHSRRRLEYLRAKAGAVELVEREERNPDETRRRRLVRRSYLVGIVAAWVITVPLSGALAALLYWIMVALFV
ncbi:inorganic phosphate transporter [Rhizobium sp. YJ-22]|uniref:inorganic phosphate transporter n=1 Tax=Rhizobium sp. YJ-22 TaxID=3037556 RepID=UPI0024127DF1|nr:inorganic phosphate transporter [Rhizobium sp. YJ-22]MDG3575095.1 inorganic phosphate transporter [Rhizobium sp. YJ-22]